MYYPKYLHAPRPVYDYHYRTFSHLPPCTYQMNHYGFPIQQRQYPDLDPTLFNQSATAMQKLMKEASLVLNKIAHSKSFAKKVMSAAQQSHLDEVEKLIQSTGVTANVDTSYTPDGINLKLSSTVGSTECCHLTIALRWRV
ncbi:hypothetical protein LCL95_11550 [Bacillus timonensis]|nr:hypothetical protein [Bacillus timonensis]